MLNVHEMEAMLPLAEAEVDEEDRELLRAVVDSYKYIAELTLEPGMTMDRLHELCFGSDAEQPEG
jgi:hypothetical protein